MQSVRCPVSYKKDSQVKNMDLKRAWHSFRLLTMRTYLKRGEYVRKHKLFHYCGENVEQNKA